MKICFVTTSFPAYKGHIQSPFIYQLARALAKKVDVTVVCPYYRKSVQRRERFDGLSVERFPYFVRRFQSLTERGGVSAFLRNPWMFFQMIFFLIGMFVVSLRVAKKSDLIHCQWALSGLVGVVVKFLRRKPLVVTLRGEDLKALDKPLMRFVIHFVLKHADYVTSNNKHHLDKIRGVAKKSEVIQNGVDVEIFKLGNALHAKRKLGLKQKHIMTYVGWFVERKGVSYLLDAVPKIIHQHSNTLLVLIGDGPQFFSLQKKVKQLGLERHVLFVGSLSPDKLVEYLHASDVFVLPSLWEGLPNVVLEAFACGVPVVATDVAGTSEVVKDKVNGFLVPPRHSSLLADRVVKILRSKALAQKFSREARKIIVQRNLTWDDCAQKHVELYQKIYS